MLRMVILVAIVASIICSAQAATIYVPDHYSTIQGAINAAANGDEIIVRPGTYVENISFLGKAITLISEQGAAVTTISGGQALPVIILNSGEGPNSIIDGFTVTNGDAADGGGIYCYYSSPTISNNIITGNKASGYGGGIYAYESSSIILENTIDNNNGLTVVAEYPAWAIPSRRLFLAISFPTIGTVQVEIADLAGEYPARDFSPQRLPIITFSETLVALVVGSYAVRIQQTYRTISFRITLPIAAVVLIAPILAQPLRTTL